MADKPDQTRLKTKKPFKNKSAIRIPISLHFYAVEIVVIILAAFIMDIYIQSLVQSFISQECTARLDEAVASTKSFFENFKLQVDESDERTEENIRAYLINSISTTDNLSTQANIALYYYDEETDKFLVLWPTAYNSSTLASTATKVIGTMFDEHGSENMGKTQTIDIDGDIFYCRSVQFHYGEKSANTLTPTVTVSPQTTAVPVVNENKPNDESIDLSNYYLFVYVNSSSYYRFIELITLALIQSALLAIIIAGLLSMVMTYPIIYSSHKLSRFARRISKGDFKPVRGHIVSKELSELGDMMNQMAYKLEESDVEQKTFFQNASHELRTPLMSIQGYAEGLKYGVFETDEDRENAIDVIIDETGRLSNLVENLLSISKMDMSRSGNFEVKKQNLDATKICDTIIDKVRGNFIHEDKTIINDINIQSIYIYGNENDLIRCLENIFANCLRYCKSAVTFSCKLDESGSNVVFEISDDGPGISPEVIDHLFERFSKGSDGKHGIGMALVKAIAEEHNGTVEAYNKPEGGACFDVIIPVVFHRDQLSKMNNDSTK